MFSPRSFLAQIISTTPLYFCYDIITYVILPLTICVTGTKFFNTASLGFELALVSWLSGWSGIGWPLNELWARRRSTAWPDKPGSVRHNLLLEASYSFLYVVCIFVYLFCYL